MDVKKLERIKELKDKRKTLDEEIKTLTEQLTADFNTAIHGERKPRKPRAPKQLSLVK